MNFRGQIWKLGVKCCPPPNILTILLDLKFNVDYDLAIKHDPIQPDAWVMDFVWYTKIAYSPQNQCHMYLKIQKGKYVCNNQMMSRTLVDQMGWIKSGSNWSTRSNRSKWMARTFSILRKFILLLNRTINFPTTRVGPTCDDSIRSQHQLLTTIRSQ